MLKATTDRSLTKRRFVILDSLNNIKGSRYELWCVARQAATRYCVVHVDTPAETCRQWNSAREALAQYEERILDDLCGRSVGVAVRVPHCGQSLAVFQLRHSCLPWVKPWCWQSWEHARDGCGPLASNQQGPYTSWSQTSTIDVNMEL